LQIYPIAFLPPEESTTDAVLWKEESLYTTTGLAMKKVKVKTSRITN
jgi:hypothetical protein